MAGMGAGYDLSVSTFSPDGRVFQVEYANKAVDSSTTSLAFACADGVVLGVHKQVQNAMVLHHKTNRRLYPVDKHIGVAVSGLIADGRQLVTRARSECSAYRQFFGEPIPVKVLAERMGLYVHAYTLYWSVRPFGASLLIASMDTGEEKTKTTGISKKKDEEIGTSKTTTSGDVEMSTSTTTATTGKSKPTVRSYRAGIVASDLKGAVYCVEPSGTCYKYLGQSIGKGKQTVQTELEKLQLNEMTCKQGLVHAARILLLACADTNSSSSSSAARDTVDVELGLMSFDTDRIYKSVGEEETAAVTQQAKQILQKIEEDQNA
eukprot:GHVS01080129.1.p1 GENE.GHVS01080129.1~~GHVS01080129.1.p1  ORF type:complete len:320 (+),score=62.80 GHVS01080129.1:348-1307(+)